MEFIIALIFLFYAAYTDIKTREVPDGWSHLFLLVAIGFNIFVSVKESSFFPIIMSIIGFTVLLFIGWLLYHFNQWGGADGKILAGLGALYGLTPFMFWYLVYFLFIGAVYSIIYSFAIAIQHRKKLTLSYPKLAGVVIAVSVALIIGNLVVPQKMIFSTLILFAFISYLLIPFLHAVEQVMIVKIPVSKAEEEWLAKDVKKGKYHISKDITLGHHHILEMKRLKIRHVFIKKGVPFIPVFFIALLLLHFTGLPVF